METSGKNRDIFTNISQSNLEGNVLRKISESVEGLNAEPLYQEERHDFPENIDPFTQVCTSEGDADELRTVVERDVT